MCWKCWHVSDTELCGASGNPTRSVAGWQLTRGSTDQRISRSVTAARGTRFNTLKFPHFWFRRSFRSECQQLMLPFSAVACYPWRVLSACPLHLQTHSNRGAPAPIRNSRYSSSTVAVFVVFVYVYFSYIFHWHSAFIGFYKYLMDFKWRLRCCRWHFIIFCFK